MMKKIAIAIIMFFALLSTLGTISAATDTEYDKALGYYDSGKYKEAITILKEYVKKKPEPSAYYRIGYALYKLRKFNEANEYFKMAYLIDPMFSLKQTGLTPPYPEQELEKPVAPSHKQTPIKKKSHAGSKGKQSGLKQEPLPKKQPSQEVQPQKTRETAGTLAGKTPLPQPQKVEPQRGIQPPAKFQPFPVPRKSMRGFPLGVPMGLLAGFGIIMILLEIAFYIYFCLCLFFIAKKLNVSAPWTAWIPIIQIWTVVASAGKPWWWILLLLVPIVNIFIGIYLWVLITENLGRNKWLGLLMLVPIVNFVFLGVLAFSKTETTGYTDLGAEA
jgi:hypothetical protein